MATISIRIDGALKRRLEDVAAANGTSVSQIVREAFWDKVEEMEDYLTVKSRLTTRSNTVSNDEVWKSLGL